MPSRLIRTAALGVAAALAAATVTACGTSAAADRSTSAGPGATTPSAPAGGHAPRTPHWSYEGADGPEHWATLSEDFATCGKGRAQSPIDLDADLAVETDAPVTVHYGRVTAELVNTGHTVQATVSPGSGSGIVVDGTAYQLRQFHFHLPSEHTEDGEHAAMEMHFVHEDGKGGLAVLGVLMRAGRGHSAFTDLWQHLPAEEGGRSRLTRPLDLTRFLPGDRDQYRYEGSLTTPPCTEGVKWTVLEDQVGVTPRQVAAYRELFPRSNRPVQPRNDREVGHVHR
ncbi:carbonic anhydrase [Streptomyces sp. G35A]